MTSIITEVRTHANKGPSTGYPTDLKITGVENGATLVEV